MCVGSRDDAIFGLDSLHPYSTAEPSLPCLTIESQQHPIKIHTSQVFDSVNRTRAHTHTHTHTQTQGLIVKMLSVHREADTEKKSV